jgi:uncharacterized protein with HEPN domain
MREAAQYARAFAIGGDYEDFLKDAAKQAAIQRALEILGEAARQVSPAFRGEHPEIAWRGIIALRNVIAHAYSEIRLERIWDVVQDELPALIPRLDELLAEDPRP